ncbi:MAG: hypothetical protein RMY33_025470 [Nostoc sp. DedQUE03]|nr:hypothetical protein [Nostoc sp. DedQUE02]
MSINFTNLPHPDLLQQLANGSIDQNHNLSRAIRLWAVFLKGFVRITIKFSVSQLHQCFPRKVKRFFYLPFQMQAIASVESLKIARKLMTNW